MANSCDLFGGLVPNIYIDRVFLEESATDTNNDGVAELQTPKISIQLKALDSQSPLGNFSILGDALQIQTADSVLDFKEYMNVYCVVFTDEDLANDFITKFENGNYTETKTYFSLPQPDSQEPYYITKKSLSDFGSTYTNSENITEVLASYQFDKSDFGEDNVFDYLQIFAFVQLDVEGLEQEMNIEFPDSFKSIVGNYQDQVVLRNSLVVSELTIFVTEDGDLWDSSFHVHRSFSGEGINRTYMEGRVHTPDIPHGILNKTSTITNNIQDFRLRDEISAFITNFDFAKSFQYDLPEQRDILNKSFSKNSYFSEIFITKDESRNGRFYFAFDYGKFILQEDKFANIISNMTVTAKAELVKNADLVRFVVKRKQVKKAPARNHLGSPVRNTIHSTETVEVPIVTSLNDNNITEIGLIMTDQPSSDTSLIRHFTGYDLGFKRNTDGEFQYSVEVEAVSAFTTILNQILRNLDLALSSYNEYVNLTQIPNIYDSKTRKYTDFGQQVLTNWDGGTRLATIINIYITALDYFVELDSYQPTGATYRDGIQSCIVRNINPTNGSVDGIILFQKMLSDLIGQVSNILSVGSNSVGAESTRENAPSDRQSLLKQVTMRAEETFDHTIGARFINDTYVDNISPIRRNPGGFPGLRTYSGNDLADASVTEVNPVNSIFVGTPEAAAAQGIIVNVMPSIEKSRFNEILSEDGKRKPKPLAKRIETNKYLGEKNSITEFPTLNKQILSPKDLTVQGKDISQKFNAPLNTYTKFKTNPELVKEGVLTEDIDTLTSEDLQTQVEVLTAFSRQGSDVTDNALIMRNPQFQVKKLGDLTSAIEYGNVYYLCKQKQQGNKDVIDAYFLVRPVSATFDTAQDIEYQPGQFLEQDATFADTVIEQVAEASNPANMTMDGVQSQFGAPSNVLSQVLSDTANMTMDGVDLAAAFNKNSSDTANTVVEQMNQATQDMTAQGVVKDAAPQGIPKGDSPAVAANIPQEAPTQGAVVQQGSFGGRYV